MTKANSSSSTVQIIIEQRTKNHLHFIRYYERITLLLRAMTGTHVKTRQSRGSFWALVGSRCCTFRSSQSGLTDAGSGLTLRFGNLDRRVGTGLGLKRIHQSICTVDECQVLDIISPSLTKGKKVPSNTMNMKVSPTNLSCLSVSVPHAGRLGNKVIVVLCASDTRLSHRDAQKTLPISVSSSKEKTRTQKRPHLCPSSQAQAKQRV